MTRSVPDRTLLPPMRRPIPVLLPALAAAQPAAPTLLEPEGGGWRYVDGEPVWSGVEGATAYRVQVDTVGRAFGAPVVDDTVDAGTDDGGSLFGTVLPGFYEWRVAALDWCVRGPRRDRSRDGRAPARRRALNRARAPS